MPAARFAASVAAAVVSSSSVLAIDNGLGLTPALGWSSWYCAPGGSQVTDAFVRANAVAMLERGLVDAGYSYVSAAIRARKTRVATAPAR